MGKERKTGKRNNPDGTSEEVMLDTIVDTKPLSLLEHMEYDTALWTLDSADVVAGKAGMLFDSSRGQYVCDWIERNCFLYEGSGAGKPLVLMEYQRKFIMRLFSWVQYSNELNRYIRRFTRANLLCPKKNGKSPLLASIALYLTIADGEQGQKVYTAAKNGKQAQITQNHAVAMVQQSPVLKDCCVVNKATLQISHTSTRSRMIILSGDDTRGAQANEGINGSIVIDELHVFDREMDERTSRSGISRPEPLHLAVSTAGDDPSSFGFERVEYGRRVAEGKQADLHFLHVEYAAPAKATDEDIAANLEEYGRMANPAWGTLVRPSEFMQDYQNSKDKPRQMARFKQYRLNLWVGSVSPWLNIAAWDMCRTKFTLEDMRGRECKLGIDLSRTRDMTGVMFNFRMSDYESQGGNPDDAPSDDKEETDVEVMRLWPMFWCPRKTVDARRHLFPYAEWEQKHELNVTEGNVVDYTQIEEEICSLAEEYQLTVTGIYFDQHYAEEFTQRLADRLYCERTAVSQTLMVLSPLCKEFERRIDSLKIQHPGNAVLDWQIGHVQIWTDRNQNYRPVKPDPNSGKCIDGVMALIDTMAGIVEGEGSSGEPSIHFN